MTPRLRMGDFINARTLPRILTGAAAAFFAVACGTRGSIADLPETKIPELTRPKLSVAPFVCDVSFTEVSTISDGTLASYGTPPMTDTAEVCAKWTGSDYRVHVTQLGTSEVGEAGDSTATVLYDAGVVSGTTRDGGTLGDATQVGATAFDFALSTPNEIAASYADPWFAVSGGGGGGSGGCYPPDCYVTERSPLSDDMVSPLSPLPQAIAQRVAIKEHNVSRAALRALLGDKEEIQPGNNGHRRFSKKGADEETIIEIDPATELVVGHESHATKSHVRAKMQWEKRGQRFVRSTLQLTSDDSTGIIPVHSSASVRILDFKFGGHQ